MARAFGALLRKLREDARVSMGDLSRGLQISVTYLSDVERGTRAPLSQERISLAAKLLSLAQPQLLKLLEVAAEDRGFFELGVSQNQSPKAMEVGAALMRGWPSYSDDDFTKIANILHLLEDKP